MTEHDQPVNGTAPDDLVDTLRLSLISGVGPRMRQALLERFGSGGAGGGAE